MSKQPVVTLAQDLEGHLRRMKERPLFCSQCGHKLTYKDRIQAEYTNSCLLCDHLRRDSD